MLDSQTLLSELMIGYSECPSQPQINDKAGAVIAAWDAQQAGTYQSPADLPLPQLFDPGTGEPLDMQKLVDDPLSGDNIVVSNAMNAAVVTYEAAVLSCNLAAVHAAIDQVNALLPITKQPAPIEPNPDLVILSSAPGILGRMCQQLLAGDIFNPQVDAKEVIEKAKKASGPASMQPSKFWLAND